MGLARQAAGSGSTGGGQRATGGSGAGRACGACGGQRATGDGQRAPSGGRRSWTGVRSMAHGGRRSTGGARHCRRRSAQRVGGAWGRRTAGGPQQAAHSGRRVVGGPPSFEWWPCVRLDSWVSAQRASTYLAPRDGSAPAGWADPTHGRPDAEESQHVPLPPFDMEDPRCKVRRQPGRVPAAFGTPRLAPRPHPEVSKAPWWPPVRPPRSPRGGASDDGARHLRAGVRRGLRRVGVGTGAPPHART